MWKQRLHLFEENLENKTSSKEYPVVALVCDVTLCVLMWDPYKSRHNLQYNKPVARLDVIDHQNKLGCILRASRHAPRAFICKKN